VESALCLSQLGKCCCCLPGKDRLHAGLLGQRPSQVLQELLKYNKVGTVSFMASHMRSSMRSPNSPNAQLARFVKFSFYARHYLYVTSHTLPTMGRLCNTGLHYKENDILQKWSAISYCQAPRVPRRPTLASINSRTTGIEFCSIYW
jgi:hypothetical protein